MEHNHPTLSLTQWSTGHESPNTISSIYILSNYIIITIYTIYIKTLVDLARPQWTRGPNFLQQPPDWWPTMPAAMDTEADKGCQIQKVHLGIASEAEWPDIPAPTQFHTWGDLIQATATFPGGCLWCVPDCACSYLHSGGAVAPDPGPETRLPW